MCDDDWGDGASSDFASKVSVSNDGGNEWDDGGSSGGGGRGQGGGGGSRGRGGGAGGGACFKCGEEGHMSRECPSGGSGGGGGGSNKCYKCQEEGHMSRDCPSGGGGGGGSNKCYKCQEEGHISRDCPSGGGGGGSNKCYKCQEEGHISRDCPSGGGGGGPNKCFKCNEEGHMSRDCPSGGADKCFRCKEEGHISRDCPNAAADGENPDEKPRPYVPPVELEGEAAFDDRKMYYEGSGINFQKYNEIKFEITGDMKVPSMNSFQDMKLRPLVMTNLTKVGYVSPTPIQKHASPQFMSALDVMACAQTGSGKTCAFLLPIINTLLNNQDSLNTETSPVHPECLILAPTRELAMQIARESRLYAQDSILRTVVCYGGAAIFAQKMQLQAGCNILVATPGRLKQFVTENIVSLDSVMFFVLDEADRMLDMGFMSDVKEIVDKMPPVEERISGMFSATFPVGVQKAAAEFLKKEYIFIVIGVVGGACSDVVQEILQVERSEKRGKLLEILRESPTEEKVLVFCNAKKGADFLAASLSSQGISTTSIHGDRLQSQRELALREFTQGKRKVLVATAVAARGLDIPKVGMVVNYDLPNEIDEYVHRIGRTGRLGHTGKAISFFEESQDSGLVANLVSILQGANQTVPDFLSAEGSGYTNGSANGFASTDHRDRVQSYGAPAPVETEEGDWD